MENLSIVEDVQGANTAALAQPYFIPPRRVEDILSFWRIHSKRVARHSRRQNCFENLSFTQLQATEESGARILWLMQNF